jgi:hypothetical protein
MRISLFVSIIFSISSNQSWGSSSGERDNGTRLTAATGAASVQCLSEDEALVDLTTTITSSGSVDSAEIWTSIDKSEFIVSGWIEPQDFVHNKRHKTAVSSFSEALKNGEHSITSCFVQSGSDGRTPKKTCSPVANFVVSCGNDDPCFDEAVFGSIVGNGNLCSGQAIPIHIKGSFGESGTLAINKDGFSTRVTLGRSGNSCVYQGQYRPQTDGHAGPGAYSFTLIGDNGSVFSFSAILNCR